MDASRSSSRASGHTGRSLPVLSLYPPQLTKDSKAQSILGLSRTELHDARGESLGSKSRSRGHLFSHTDSPLLRNPFTRTRNKLTKASPRESRLSTQDWVRDLTPTYTPDIASPSQATSHCRNSSISTLRSSCDGSSTLRISQQTSTASSRELLLRQTGPDVVATQNSDMEQPRSLRFQSPKLRSIKENMVMDEKLVELDSKDVVMPISRESSISDNTNRSPFVTKDSLVSRPSTPPMSHPKRSNKTPPGGDQHLNTGLSRARAVETAVVSSIMHTPYAKVHVRRPKMGTKHWFDDVEDFSSDEEQILRSDTEKQDILGPEPEQAMSNSLSVDRIKETHILVGIDEVTQPPKRSTAPVSSSSGSYQAVTLPSREFLADRIQKTNPLDTADLRQESVLCLSASDNEQEDDTDEEENDGEDNPKSFQPVKLLDSPLQLRKSPPERMDRNLNIASVRTTVKKSISQRPSPIKIGGDRTRSAAYPSSPPTTPAPRNSTRHITRNQGPGYSDESDARDTDDDVLLSSFPATPTESNWPRSSTSLSDDRSVVSMRLMKVTRQEENLIAAMRMKRAAMKRAEKAAERKSATSRVEDEKIVVPAKQSSIAERVPTPGDIVGGHKVSVPDLMASQRSSEIPLLADYSQGLQSSQSSPARSDHQLSGRSSTSLSRKSYAPFPRAHSSGPATTGTSQQRTSNMIVLDNLDSALQSSNLPSHLLLESPFVSWEKSNSATVH